MTSPAEMMRDLEEDDAYLSALTDGKRRGYPLHWLRDRERLRAALYVVKMAEAYTGKPDEDEFSALLEALSKLGETK